MNTESIERIREKIRLAIIDGCLQIIDAEDVSADTKLLATIMLNDAYAYMTEKQLKGESNK